MTTPTEGDLNTVIVSAVNARVEAAVAAALSGDEVIGKYVAAALSQPVEVGDRYSRSKQVPFLRHVIDHALRDAAQRAVQRFVTDEADAIERAVRTELRNSVDALAVQLVGSMNDAVERSYGITVNLKYPGRD